MTIATIRRNCWTDTGRARILAPAVRRERPGPPPYRAFRRVWARVRRGAYPSGMAGAAFFDLDRTLLKGGVRAADHRGAVRRRPGAGERHPWAGVHLQALRRRRRDPSVDGAGPRRGVGGQGLVAGRGARGGQGRGGETRHAGRALRAAAARRAPGGRPQAGAGDDHAARSDRAAGRAPRLRRRRRDPVRERRRRRHVHRRPRRRLRLVTGKLEAVKAWADQHGVDLADSYAYSDSIYDTPLLSAVGHPAAVNPDPRLLAFATLRRWPVAPPRCPAGRAEARPVRAAPTCSSSLPVPSSSPTPASTSTAPSASLGKARPSSSATTAATSTPLRSGSRSLEAGRTAALPRQEGGLRRADRRPAGHRYGRHPRRPGDRLGRAARARPPPRSKPASWWR